MAVLELLTFTLETMIDKNTDIQKTTHSPLLIAEVIGSTSDNDNWTCGCLYKCNDCIKLDSNGENKRDYFERKDLDYWDE